MEPPDDLLARTGADDLSEAFLRWSTTQGEAAR